MPGIYGVFLKNKKISEFYKHYMSFNPVVDEKTLDKGIIGRSVINKLSQDRFFKSKDGITICFEGVNLNDKLKSFEDFHSEYQKDSVKFIKNLKGSFSGIILDENIHKVFIFNDHLSTQNIFYFYDKNLGFVFSSELKAISKLFLKNKVPFSLNRDAVYMMALYGFLLDDNTYIKELKKLDYSSIIVYDYESNIFERHKYFEYSSKKIDVPIDEAIQNINYLFQESVNTRWAKDLEYGDRHISFLSGGMDAKTNVLVAKSLGFENIRTITFGQSNSTDVAYAQKIALKENFDYFQRFLDFPNYLTENIMKNYIEPVDGLMMFHSSAHASSTIRSLDLSLYSTIHTGQLGDSLFGSFTKPNFNFEVNKGAIGYTGKVVDTTMLNKIQMLPDFLKKYQDLNYDLFNIEQRQINATLFGDKALNSIVDSVSPFMDLDLVNYCLSLPDKYKKNQILYFAWLNRYHRNILNYPWEKIQLKPNNKFKIVYGRYYKKYFNGAKKYFHLNYDSMNPYAIWIKKYPFILEALNQTLNEEIDSHYIDTELKKDLIQIYNQDIFEFRNKFAVITALLALKLHFQD